MVVLVSVLPWLLIGVGTCLLHAFLVQRALARVTGLAPTDAGRRMRKGLPLRLLVVAPFLLVAARTGLSACVGWTAGSLLGRWLIARYHTRVGSWLASMTSKQG